MLESRGETIVQMMGRKRLSQEEAEAGAETIDAASRILAVLLATGDRAERGAMLPDAFTPGDEVSVE